MNTALAVDVVTIDTAKSSNELTVVATDDSLNSAMDKQFVTRSCRLRYQNNAGVMVRENYFPKVCRAEVIQFLMNQGYKPDTFFSVFTK